MSVESQPGLRSGLEDGVEWKLLLAPLGNSANGYVRLPAGHPWTALGDYFEIPADVHGGLTYGPEPERDLRPFLSRVSPPHATAWIGFDTAHLGDWWSDSELSAIGGTPRPELRFSAEREWTLDALERETRALAAQVAAAVAAHATDNQEVSP